MNSWKQTRATRAKSDDDAVPLPARHLPRVPVRAVGCLDGGEVGAPQQQRRLNKALPMIKSSNVFRVGIFLDFVGLTTRTEGPHRAYVRGAKRNRIDRHRGGIERLATRTVGATLPSSP